MIASSYTEKAECRPVGLARGQNWSCSEKRSFGCPSLGLSKNRYGRSPDRAARPTEGLPEPRETFGRRFRRGRETLTERGFWMYFSRSKPPIPARRTD
jgi:hypothetical protein